MASGRMVAYTRAPTLLPSGAWTPRPSPRAAQRAAAHLRARLAGAGGAAGALAAMAGQVHELPVTVDGRRYRPSGPAFDVVAAARPRARARHARPTRPARTRSAPSRQRARPRPRRGGRCPSTSARPSCCARPTCWPARGATGSTPRRCSASPRPCYQAEIDAACELADFWRFNVALRRGRSSPSSRSQRPGIWNRIDHRPLEGFVYAITPFNFTAIAGNLPTAPALMGNTVVWKPSPTQQLAAHCTMQLLEEAGLPPGVINLLTGDGRGGLRGRCWPTGPGRHPLHRLHARRSSTCGGRSASTSTRYAAYPRLVGETGGKDFVVAHPVADVDVLRTALVRGAFEYQGQKCSAASRAYVPRSLWAPAARRPGRRDRGADRWATSPTSSNFIGAVIDRPVVRPS